MTIRLLAILGLVLAFYAGRLAAAGRLDAGAHTAVALLAGGLSIAGHVRSGRGLDLGATLLLVLAMGLGAFVAGGAVPGHLDVAVGGAAVVLSASVHGAHLWERLRT